jgi:hypothetical protein
MKGLICYLLFTIYCLSYAYSFPSPIFPTILNPANQFNALVDLYNSTNGNGWIFNVGWIQNNDYCSWYGITCDGINVRIQAKNYICEVPQTV